MPGQPLADGVMVIVDEIVVVPVLVAENADTLPVPLPPRPIEVFELVQLNEVPGVELVTNVAEAASPLQ